MAVELAWTVGQTAERLNCSTKTVRRMVQSGQLLEVRLGRAVRIPVHSVESLVGRKSSGAAPRPTRKRRP